MAQTAIERLFFSIGLIDKVTGPAKGMNKAITQMQKNFTTGFKQVALGGAGIYGAVRGILGMTSAARDFNKAIGEVKSLGVATGELGNLGKASKKFVMRFGGDAAEIVRSAYDVQSAIPGMVKGALGAFTYQSALLAKAGKAAPAEATEYMGSMFNIFKETANKVGQAKWVEQLTGKTAHAIKIFKTTTGGMSAAFKSMGAIGTQMKLSMSEQIGVLGTLQATMSAPEAGTAFKSMLGKYAQAQKVLNMSFKDSAGNMLPTYQIIDKIGKRIGHLSDDAKIGVLNQAFGEVGAKAVMNLIGDPAGLKQSIDSLKKINNATGAEKMAQAMTDPLERLTSIGKVFGITFGQIILPGVNLVLDALSSFGATLVWLIDVFPPLRWAIAAVTAAVVAFTISWGVMKIAVGAHNLWLALAAKIRIVNISLWKMNVISGTMTKTQKAAAIANWLWHSSINKVSGAVKFLRLNLIWNKTVMIASAIWTKVLAIAQGAIALGFLGSCAAVWSFTVALLACPITWIVIGVMALVGAIVALIYYWDEVCNFVVKYADYLLMLLGPIGWVISAFRNWDKITAWLSAVWDAFKKVCPDITSLLEKLFYNGIRGFKVLFSFFKNIWKNIVNFFSSIWNGIIDKLSSFFLWIAKLGTGAWDGIIKGIKEVHNWLADLLLPIIQAVGKYFEWLGGLGSSVWDGIKSVFSNIDGWIGKLLKTLSKIPGLGFLDPDVNVNKTTKIERPVVPSVAAARKTDTPAGGIRNSNTKVNNFGGVTIHTSNPVGPGEIEDMWALQA